ncbi:hypothetical protein ESCNG_110041 [Neisseria gonorrhoeae]|uniref:Uncharacterized protein n=1 Tax=Neisseria gonorrhoeae TaxID=485 RepID=A0AB74EMY8_NEIGO|nr:hypothetical protein ESCNG_110041 [Neisseria gonorrhoeae]SCW09503.1 hypothetical protein ESCNG_150008 [Neisseria gonorrhoeae]SCW09919.1 hypothetical protein ESCNG_120035 [Neisseria gonorrhoeae]SCW18908.1 hypothetical protein ESCNG_510008 [Neisseria gonorrhoeae]
MPVLKAVVYSLFSGNQAIKKHIPFTVCAFLSGGGKRDRTADLLHAMQALYQLSYTPENLVANQGLEPRTQGL